MKVTTSIKVDSELWARVKIHCIRNNLKVSDFIEHVLKKEIK